MLRPNQVTFRSPKFQVSKLTSKGLWNLMRCASNNRFYGCRPHFPRFLLFRSWHISGYIRFWRENVPNIKYFQFFSEKTRLELLQITGMAFISRDLLSCPCLWPGANKLWLGANTGTVNAESSHPHVGHDVGPQKCPKRLVSMPGDAGK